MRAYGSHRFIARAGGVGLSVFLLAASGCTPAPQPSPGGSGSGTGPASSASTPPPSSTAPASSPASPSGSTPSSTPPPDSDETATPQNDDHVISSAVTHGWAWPGPGTPFHSTHSNPVPLAPPPAAPLPTLDTIGAGKHPTDNPPYDQLSFRFNGAFPSYDISFVPELLADGSGQPIPMPGTGAILKVVFHGAQAHTADGTATTVRSSPAPSIGYQALTSYAPAGDFEGVLSYGIGVGRPVTTAPQTRVRVYEVEKIEQGRHVYVVAVQLDASSWK